VTSLSEDKVYDAIVRYHGVKGAAAHLGVSRQALYQRFPNVVKRAQDAQRGAARSVRLRLPVSLVEQLDERAAAAGTNRAHYVLVALATLPEPLPAPDPGAWNGSGNKGVSIHVKLRASTWTRLEDAGAPAARLRALLIALAAGTLTLPNHST
jgi:hypothetical protein